MAKNLSQNQKIATEGAEDTKKRALDLLALDYHGSTSSPAAAFLAGPQNVKEGATPPSEFVL